MNFRTITVFKLFLLFIHFPVVVSTGSANDISGAIYDYITGEPIPGVSIHITSQTWGGSFYADDNGKYSSSLFYQLPEGTYKIYVEPSSSQPKENYIDQVYKDTNCLWGCRIGIGDKGQNFVVSSDTIIQNIDFFLKRGGQIAGHITDSITNEPIPNTKIAIYDVNGEIAGYSTTDYRGYFLSRGLPDGEYYLTTFNEDGYLNSLHGNIICQTSCKPTEGVKVTVITEQISEANFSLTKGIKVSGFVLDESTKEPIFLLNVSIYNKDGIHVGTGWTDNYGKYEIDGGLTPGIYYLNTVTDKYINKLSNGAVCTGYTCNYTIENSIELLASDEIRSFDFLMSTGGKISGAVTNSKDQTPIEGVWIWIYNEDGDLAARAETDKTGRYISDTPLNEGLYFLSTSNSLGYEDQYYNGTPCGSKCLTNPLAASPIKLEKNEHLSGIDLSLKKYTDQYTFENFDPSLPGNTSNASDTTTSAREGGGALSPWLLFLLAWCIRGVSSQRKKYEV